MKCRVDELILHDVRCFPGERRGRIKPITLLVGENSTGKTTFLGCHSVLRQLVSGIRVLDQQFDFNREPFLMGSFSDIASSNFGNKDNSGQFKIGLTYSPFDSADASGYCMLASFSEQGSQPVLSSLEFQYGSNLFLKFIPSKNNETIVEIPDDRATFDFPFSSLVIFMEFISRPEGQELLGSMGESILPRQFIDNLMEFRDRLDKSGSEIQCKEQVRIPLTAPQFDELIPIAPLRTKPKRTYDPIRETPSPEGKHIPMLMMRLDRTDGHHSNSLRESLADFGRQSGLFSDVTIKRHGEQTGDPFQLQVKVRTEAPSNIMDVGYGVSQILPILVDVLAASEGPDQREGGCTFSLQQPEIHLHPRAQAELASFFVESYRKHNNRFLIETHSDQIIDRFRIAVRNNRLSADEVSILYFEPKEDGVTVHNMSLDEHGNLEDAPDGYRSFFETETDRLLGFKD